VMEKSLQYKTPPAGPQANTWIEHDCKEDVWHSSADHRYISCMICKRILKFRFRSSWKHFKMLFWNGVERYMKYYWGEDIVKVYYFMAIEENHVIISDTIKDAINIFMNYKLQGSTPKRWKFVSGVVEYLGDGKSTRVKDLPGGTLCIQNVYEWGDKKEIFYERYDVRETEFQKNRLY